MEQHQKQPKQVLVVYNNNNNSIYIGVQGGGRGWLPPPPRLLCRLGQSGNIRFTVGQYYYKNKMEKFSQYIGEKYNSYNKL
jgi:hypothetical protein